MLIYLPLLANMKWKTNNIISQIWKYNVYFPYFMPNDVQLSTRIGLTSLSKFGKIPGDVIWRTEQRCMISEHVLETITW